jgi:hypothetical protein
MTILKRNETFKGVAELAIIRLADGALLNIPKPLNVVIDNQIDQRIQMTQNSQGEMTRANSYIKGRTPTIRLVYSHIQPELLQFKTGRLYESQTKSMDVVKSYLVTTGTFAGETSVSKSGHAVLEDAPSKASIIRNNLSVQLVQQPYDTFNATTNDTFAIGANLAVKFSTNLVTAKEIVTLTTTESLTVTGIGDDIIGAHKIIAMLVTTENQLVSFKAENCSCSFEGSAIDFGADQMEIPWFINDVPGACFPYTLDYTSKYVGC